MILSLLNKKRSYVFSEQLGKNQNVGRLIESVTFAVTSDLWTAVELFLVKLGSHTVGVYCACPPRLEKEVTDENLVVNDLKSCFRFVVNGIRACMVAKIRKHFLGRVFGNWKTDVRYYHSSWSGFLEHGLEVADPKSDRRVDPNKDVGKW